MVKKALFCFVEGQREIMVEQRDRLFKGISAVFTRSKVTLS